MSGNSKVIDITKTIAKEVISIKRERKIKLPDAIIVATAIVESATLFTNDKQLHTIGKLNISYIKEI